MNLYNKAKIIDKSHTHFDLYKNDIGRITEIVSNTTLVRILWSNNSSYYYKSKSLEIIL